MRYFILQTPHNKYMIFFITNKICHFLYFSYSDLNHSLDLHFRVMVGSSYESGFNITLVLLIGGDVFLTLIYAIKLPLANLSNSTLF